MIYNKESHITSTKEVEKFFDHLLEERKLNFHPDTPFEDYINIETREPSFTQEEAETYNRLMEESFSICETEGVDIYEIGCDKLFATFEQ